MTVTDDAIEQLDTVLDLYAKYTKRGTGQFPGLDAQALSRPRPGRVGPQYPELDIAMAASDPPDPGVKPPPPEQPGRDADSRQRVNHPVDHAQLGLCRPVHHSRVLRVASAHRPPRKHGAGDADYPSITGPDTNHRHLLILERPSLVRSGQTREG
jgi:hypothetical protein